MPDPNQYLWLMPGSIIVALLGCICGLLGSLTRQAFYDHAHIVPSRKFSAVCAVLLTAILIVTYMATGVPAPWLHWVVNVTIMETAAVSTAACCQLDTTPYKLRRRRPLFPPRSDDDNEDPGNR